MLLLGSCSQGETKTYINPNLPTGESEVTLTYKQDEVLKMEMKNTIIYQKLVMTANDPGPTKEEVEEWYQPEIAHYEGLEGISHEFEFTDTKAIETLAVEYKKLDYD